MVYRLESPERGVPEWINTTFSVPYRISHQGRVYTAKAAREESSACDSRPI